MSFTAAPELFTQAFDDTGDVYDAIATETAELSFDTALMFDADYMEMIGGGLFTKSVVSGGATAVDNQVFEGFIDVALNSMELASGDDSYIANGEPLVTSVTGSLAGVLAADDDYTIVIDDGSYSGYSIVFNTAGTAGLVITEDVTIVYNSPVVVGETTIDFGGIKNYAPVEGYLDTVNRAGKTVRISFYKAFYNANFTMAGGAENSPEAAVSNFVFSIKPDTTRAVGKQLYSWKVLE
jgi:hypothetical protein